MAGKNVKICDFGLKKPSDFGKDLFSLLKFVISAKKSLRFSAKTFFFGGGDHLLLARKNVKICDLGQKKPSYFGETFAPLILILTPRSHEAGDAPAASI